MLKIFAGASLLALSLVGFAQAQENNSGNAAVSLGAAKEVAAGEPLEVIWAGPSDSGDYLAISIPDSPLTSFSAYARTSAGNPAILTAPDALGVYEIRYISPTTNAILASRLMVVGEIEISLTSPAAIQVNTGFDVSWEGPVFDGDMLVLVPTEAAEEDIIASQTATNQRLLSFDSLEIAGEYEIQYQDINGRILALASLVVTPVATINAPAQLVAGADIVIEWNGPNFEGDQITIVPKDMVENITSHAGQTHDNTQIKITTPDIPGLYEIRYILESDQSVIAVADLELTKPEITLQTVEEARPGSEISLAWTGPENQNDYLTIVPKDAEEGSGDITFFTQQGSPITVQLPDLSGDYEIRYVSGQSGRTLEMMAISVAIQPTFISAAETIIVGSTIMVSWEGPQTPDDLITIVPIETPDHELGNFTYTREGAELGVITEAILGDYELRYVSGETNEVLARLAVTIVAPPISILAPDTAVAGMTISVEWAGPDGNSDFIALVPIDAIEGTYGNYTYTRNGTPLDVITKDIAGEYEIRYVDGQTFKTMISEPITLVTPDASVQTQGEAVAGREITVSWTGPDNQNDLITVVPVGTPIGRYSNYTFTRRGADLTVLTPDMAGDFEVRYLSGQSFLTLASFPLVLTAPQITIDASPVGVAGQILQVIWSGPANKNDFLTVAPVGAQETTLGAYQYTRKGSPLDMVLPDAPGSYEIRYISGQSMRVLQSLPLIILAP